MNYLYLHDPFTFGHVRRKTIKDWFETHPDGAIPINKKWQVQLKHDLDLKKLVKSGYLKQIRECGFTGKHPMGWKRSGSGQTYLVKA